MKRDVNIGDLRLREVTDCGKGAEKQQNQKSRLDYETETWKEGEAIKWKICASVRMCECASKLTCILVCICVRASV
mgnify:CR=1 FL=1